MEPRNTRHCIRLWRNYVFGTKTRLCCQIREWPKWFSTKGTYFSPPSFFFRQPHQEEPSAGPVDTRHCIRLCRNCVSRKNTSGLLTSHGSAPNAVLPKWTFLLWQSFYKVCFQAFSQVAAPRSPVCKDSAFHLFVLQLRFEEEPRHGSSPNAVLKDQSNLVASNLLKI